MIYLLLILYIISIFIVYGLFKIKENEWFIAECLLNDPAWILFVVFWPISIIGFPVFLFLFLVFESFYITFKNLYKKYIKKY